VLIDEVLPKGMFVFNQVATQRMAADGRLDGFTGMAVYMRL
jgi:hypothetical protein